MTETGYTARAAMLIRKPVAEVYEAFVDPAVTSRFWFTDGSARLDAGQPVTWAWAMLGATAEVTVTALEPNRRIAIRWGEGEDTTPVEWTFTDRGDQGTFVEIENAGLATLDELVAGTEGFTLVLANCKAELEHSLQLGLVADRFPPDPGATTG
jgi:uncharacterized protein YndB with AHSA1/START domain